jgi:hypothetical protein
MIRPTRSPATVVLAVAIGISLLAAIFAARSDAVAPAGPPQSPPDPVARELVNRLALAARGVPERGVRQLTHVTSMGRWTLGSAGSGKWFCFALGVPRTTIESSCATRTQIARQKLLVYGGAAPRKQGSGWAAYVVYGVVSPLVQHLTVNLSDCTSLSVKLSKRPLFWVFVPAAKLARRVLPIAYVGYAGGKKLSSRLRPLGVAPRGGCAH